MATTFENIFATIIDGQLSEYQRTRRVERLLMSALSKDDIPVFHSLMIYISSDGKHVSRIIDNITPGIPYPAWIHPRAIRTPRELIVQDVKYLTVKKEKPEPINPVFHRGFPKSLGSRSVIFEHPNHISWSYMGFRRTHCDYSIWRPLRMFRSKEAKGRYCQALVNLFFPHRLFSGDHSRKIRTLRDKTIPIHRG